MIKLYSSLVTRILRETDIAFRISGETFALLLPNTNQEVASTLAENIRIVFESNNHPVVGKLTASFGVAERKMSESLENWYERLNDLLCTAKSNGRNQVVHSNQKNEPFVTINFRWDSEWNSGNTIIDSQHKKIIELIGTIFQQAYGKTDFDEMIASINALYAYIKLHFDQEEELLKACDYWDYENHKKQHEALLAKFTLVKYDYVKGNIKASSYFLIRSYLT